MINGKVRTSKLGMMHCEEYFLTEEEAIAFIQKGFTR